MINSENGNDSGETESDEDSEEIDQNALEVGDSGYHIVGYFSKVKMLRIIHIFCLLFTEGGMKRRVAAKFPFFSNFANPNY